VDLKIYSVNNQGGWADAEIKLLLIQENFFRLAYSYLIYLLW